MPVPSAISDLSTTPSLNSPAGSESPALVDDYLRTHAAFIKQVNDASVKTTGDQTVAGTKTFSSAPVVPGLNGGQLAGMRNKIINGKMEIAQRGTSFAAAAGYTLDRWTWGTSSAAVVTISQQADVPSDNEFQSSLRIAVTTADTSIAASDAASIEHKIEGYSVRDLIGKTFTLSFRVRSSKTGVHCVAFGNSTPDRSFIAEYTVNTANTWETKTVTVPGGLITAGTWNWTSGIGLRINWTLAAGSTFQTTAGAWQTGNFYATSSQVNVLDTIGNIFAITGVQLEVGSVATPFEHRPYGAELALCQRYYETGSAVAQAAVSLVNGARYGNVSFAAAKRAIPTVTVSSYAGTVGRATNLDGYTDAAANTATATEIYANGFGVRNTTGGTISSASNIGFGFNFTATAEL